MLIGNWQRNPFLDLQASSGIPPQKLMIKKQFPVEKAFKHSALHIVSGLKWVLHVQTADAAPWEL